MNIAVLNTTTAAPFVRFQAVAETISSFIAQQRKYNEVRRELQALSERELDDIGVRRADIPAIARDHAKRA